MIWVHFRVEHKTKSKVINIYGPSGRSLWMKVNGPADKKWTACETGSAHSESEPYSLEPLEQVSIIRFQTFWTFSGGRKLYLFLSSINANQIPDHNKHLWHSKYAKSFSLPFSSEKQTFGNNLLR